MFDINEIMSTDLVTLSPTATLADAHELMTTRRIRHLPVVDDGGKLVGLVTQSDLLAAMDSPLLGLSETQRSERERSVRVSEVMTTSVKSIDERADLRAAARYLEATKHGCLPVVTDGELRGIITDTDFVSVAINLMESLEEHTLSRETPA